MDGVVYCVDLDDGKQLWKTPVGESIRTSVCILEDGVVVGTTDGFLHCLDGMTGAVKEQNGLGRYPTGTIVERDGLLLVCADWLTPGSELIFIKSSLTEVAWRAVAPDGTVWSMPRPYIYEDHVFLGNNRGGVFEYRLGDGELVRNTHVDGVVRGILLVDDVLYVGNQSGTVYATKR